MGRPELVKVAVLEEQEEQEAADKASALSLL